MNHRTFGLRGYEIFIGSFKVWTLKKGPATVWVKDISPIQFDEKYESDVANKIFKTSQKTLIPLKISSIAMKNYQMGS